MLYNIPFMVTHEYMLIFEDAFFPTRYQQEGYVYVKVTDYFSIRSWLALVSQVLHTDYDGPIGDEDQDTIGLLKVAIDNKIGDPYSVMDLDEVVLVKKTLKLINDLRHMYGDNIFLNLTTDASALIEVT